MDVGRATTGAEVGAGPRIGLAYAAVANVANVAARKIAFFIRVALITRGSYIGP